MEHLLELVSLALTVVTIIISVDVVLHWIPNVRRSLSSRQAFTAEEWLILGVCVSFIGSSLDNTYWLTAWSSFYIDRSSTLTAQLMENGYLANIPFRQFSGIFAAFCHMNAAVLYSASGTKRLRTTMLIALSLGILYSMLLIFITPV